mgnify:FL=1|jgi:hypothetical protein|nr:MAG TPA: hypothetical protein [Caudoviricetes sp.]DAS05799.1 MAG TPA: hypothetical protein [Caudoviricetes sp.]DAX77145.1 MAG TPA: hypothetical protein [Caudoviricetes sp.]DAX93815.1 MAG TPA: hypothetical protein [Caudoviricetes sp.]
MSKGLPPDALKALKRKMRDWRKSRSHCSIGFSEEEAWEVLHIHYVNLCDGLIGGANAKKPIDAVFVIQALEVILREYR